MLFLVIHLVYTQANTNKNTDLRLFSVIKLISMFSPFPSVQTLQKRNHLIEFILPPHLFISAVRIDHTCKCV